MDCDTCGRTTIIEEKQPDETVHCPECISHLKGQHPPRCAACRIEALPGFNLGKVSRLSDDEMLMALWFFEKGDICWRSLDGRQLVVIPGSGREAYGLLVDENGWCKRRQ